MLLGWTAGRKILTERIRLIELLPRASGAGLATLCMALLTTALVPPLNALASGWLVREVTESAASSGGLTPVILPIAVLFLLLVVFQFARLGQQVASQNTSRQIDAWVRRRVREIVLAPPGISHLEDSSFQNDVARASDLGEQWMGGRSPGAAATGQLILLSRIASAVLAAAVLARFSFVLAVALLAISLLTRSILRRQWLHVANIMDAGVDKKRRADYWSDLALNATTATEVRLFGLGDWLTTHRDQAAKHWLEPIWQERRTVLRRQGPIIALSFGSAFAALLFPGIAAAEGRIQPDELVMYLVAAWGIFSISYMGGEAFNIAYGEGAVEALSRLTTRHGLATASGLAPASSGQPAPSLRLENTSFAYPGTHDFVLDHLDLDVTSGETLAVVGHNGVGKTTLVKLLAGLYQPTAGRILVDGFDLANLNVERWREKIAVVFQDFIHYPATIRENIALSAPEHLADIEGIQEAAERAGAADMIAKLPDGFNTPLVRGLTGGVDLSGGQWQKIALARVLFAETHGRRLLILDEPTAHLDVRAEAEFFEQVIDAVASATIVLISHRLSMVRQADRIAMLDDGRVAELGTHDELVAQGGEYERLFRLQASRFAATEQAS